MPNDSQDLFVISLKYNEIWPFLFIKMFFIITIFFWPHCVTCGILIPRPVIKPMHHAWDAQSLNHWTARGVLKLLYWKNKIKGKSHTCALISWVSGYLLVRLKAVTLPTLQKRAKWLSEAALQIAVKRKEAKNKGEKERYTHLNGQFQRIARRNKKAFLNDQCKEIEENNIIGKTRDLFKKIRDTKGTFKMLK